MRHLKNSSEACHLSFSHLISNLTVKMLLLPIEILYMIFKRLNYNDAHKLALVLASAAGPQTRVTTARSLLLDSLRLSRFHIDCKCEEKRYCYHPESRLKEILNKIRKDIDAQKAIMRNETIEKTLLSKSATCAGLYDIFETLLEDPRVDPSAYNNYAIVFASDNGHLEVVKLLLKDPRVDPSAKDNYSIELASENGHHEVVKLLLKDPRVDPSDDNNYAIRMASENGYNKVVELLLKDPRVDPSDEDNEAIRMASQAGDIEVVKLLLKDPRVDPSAHNNYAIRIASYKGHHEVVKLLLKHPRVDPSDEVCYAT